MKKLLLLLLFVSFWAQGQRTVIGTISNTTFILDDDIYQMIDGVIDDGVTIEGRERGSISFNHNNPWEPWYTVSVNPFNSNDEYHVSRRDRPRLHFLNRSGNIFPNDISRDGVLVGILDGPYWVPSLVRANIRFRYDFDHNTLDTRDHVRDVLRHINSSALANELNPTLDLININIAETDGFFGTYGSSTISLRPQVPYNEFDNAADRRFTETFVHEMGHAYHDLLVEGGFSNADIQRHYDALILAIQSNEDLRAYWSTNVKEFFAECTLEYFAVSSGRGNTGRLNAAYYNDNVHAFMHSIYGN